MQVTLRAIVWFLFLLSALSTSCPKEGQLLCKDPGIKRTHGAEPQSTHSHSHRQNIMWAKSKLVIVKPLFGACLVCLLPQHNLGKN